MEDFKFIYLEINIKFEKSENYLFILVILKIIISYFQLLKNVLGLLL